MYDTESAEWQRLNSISRYRHAIAIYNDKLYIHGGFEPEYAAQPLDSLINIDLSMFKSAKTAQNK